MWEESGCVVARKAGPIAMPGPGLPVLILSENVRHGWLSKADDDVI